MIDITRGETVYKWFRTTKLDGTPITLAGSPVVKSFIGSGTVGITTGITLTVDAGSVTGRHLLAVVTTAISEYIPGQFVACMLTAGTVDSISVVGQLLLEFTIENAYDGAVFEGTAAGVAAGSLTQDPTDTDGAVGDTIRVINATLGSKQERLITAVNTGVYTLDRNWTTTPTGSVLYRRYPGSLALTAAEIATVLLAAATSTPIAADVQNINTVVLLGDGSPSNLFRVS